MLKNRIIALGVSGTIVGGLALYYASVRVEHPVVYAMIVALFIFTPSIACYIGGLRDYRIAMMVAIYTLIGVCFFGAMRPAVAVAPSRQQLHRAERQLSGDIGAYREAIGGCVLAIGRIAFIRKKKIANA